VAKLVARLLAKAALWVRIQTSLSKKKKKMGGISNGVANTAIDLSPTYVNYIVTAHFLVVLLWEKFEILEHNLSHILGIKRG
jgi:hypothetical protein